MNFSHFFNFDFSPLRDIRVNRQFLLLQPSDEIKLKSDAHFKAPSDWSILVPKELANVFPDTSGFPDFCDADPCENGGDCISNSADFTCQVSDLQ